MEDIERMWPHVKLIPLPTHGGPTKGVATAATGEKFPYEWIPGMSLCKSSEDHDCPFLRGVKGDEERACALHGTEDQYMWEKFCKFFPPEFFETKGQVDSWYENNPDCSYTYIKQDDNYYKSDRE